MASDFKINKQGIAKLQRELEREFARNPIRVPIVAEASIGGASGGMVVNYNGPVVTVNGDHAQLAWSNDTCLLYTSPSPRDRQKSRMPSSA